MLRLLCLFYLVGKIRAGGAEFDWGYRDHNGPDSWPDTCQGGLSQSPIDIRMKDVDYAILHRLHFVHYDFPGKVKVFNDGWSVKVEGFKDWGLKQPYIQGGGLKHKYRLEQFHIHWSSHDHHGSEHRIGGLHYPAELHLVHVRSDLTIQQAIKKPDGLAVVGVFLMVDHDGGPMAALDNAMDQIIYSKNESIMMGFRTRPLLPQVTETFYRYEGSLTTPGCAESVIWTLLAEPISITSRQIKALRALHAKDNKPIEHNYRHAQPLNGRRVLFRPAQFDRSLLCSSSSFMTIFFPIIVFGLIFLGISF